MICRSRFDLESSHCPWLLRSESISNRQDIAACPVNIAPKGGQRAVFNQQGDHLRGILRLISD
jgi:hypothetical protein